jgi:hypothetical protein
MSSDLYDWVDLYRQLEPVRAVPAADAHLVEDLRAEITALKTELTEMRLWLAWYGKTHAAMRHAAQGKTDA